MKTNRTTRSGGAASCSAGRAHARSCDGARIAAVNTSPQAAAAHPVGFFMLPPDAPRRSSTGADALHEGSYSYQQAVAAALQVLVFSLFPSLASQYAPPESRTTRMLCWPTTL